LVPILNNINHCANFSATNVIVMFSDVKEPGQELGMMVINDMSLWKLVILILYHKKKKSI